MLLIVLSILILIVILILILLQPLNAFTRKGPLMKRSITGRRIKIKRTITIRI